MRQFIKETGDAAAKAYKEGKYAYDQGLKLTDNPYYCPPDQKRSYRVANEFARGWLYALNVDRMRGG